jgi:hypothetical protein
MRSRGTPVGRERVERLRAGAGIPRRMGDAIAFACARVTRPTPVPKTERTNLPFDDVPAWRLRGRAWQHTTGLPGAGKIVAAGQRRAGFPYEHFGIYLGDGTVIHFAKERGAYRARKATIQRTPAAEFARGSKRLSLKPEEGGVVFSPGMTIARALTRVGTGDYDLWRNNCEHFVRWCLTDEPYSDQVRPRRVAESSWNSSIYSSRYSYRRVRRRVPERTTEQIRAATARPFSFDRSWRRGPPSIAPIWLGWIGRAGNKRLVNRHSSAAKAGSNAPDGLGGALGTRA